MNKLAFSCQGYTKAKPRLENLALVKAKPHRSIVCEGKKSPCQGYQGYKPYIYNYIPLLTFFFTTFFLRYSSFSLGSLGKLKKKAYRALVLGSKFTKASNSSLGLALV